MCDYEGCGITYRCFVTEGTPLTISAPADNSKTVSFACQRTGKYKFIISGKDYDYGIIYDSTGSYTDPDDNYYGSPSDTLSLTAGESCFEILR